MMDFVAIEADELGDPTSIGDVIECDLCGERHSLDGGTDAEGNVTSIILTYRCGEQSYLAAVDGRLIIDRFRTVRAQQKEEALDESDLSTIQCSGCKRRWTLAFDDSGICPHCGEING